MTKLGETEFALALVFAGVALGFFLIYLSYQAIGRSGESNKRDHTARALVAIGVAFVSLSGAFAIYQISLLIVRDQERFLMALNFRKASWQYTVAAYQLRSTRYYCDLYAENMTSRIEKKKSSFDQVKCQVSVRFAVNASRLIPTIDSIYGQAAKGSKAFPHSARIQYFLLDGDTSVRARVPAVIEANMGETRATARVRGAVTAEFADAMYDLQRNADAVGALLCVLTSRVLKGWKEFDEAVDALERGLDGPFDDKYPSVLKELAAATPFANSDCAHLRDSLQKVLPTTGGGNGGGDGG